MSEPEQQQEAPRGSVKIVLNAKGDAQLEVKVYADDDPALIERARGTALENYRLLFHQVYGRAWEPPATREASR